MSVHPPPAIYYQSLLPTEAALEGVSVRPQGGVMSLMALRSNYSLAGVVCLSGYLPLATQPPEMSPANERTPAFMCHGEVDRVVRDALCICCCKFPAHLTARQP